MKKFSGFTLCSILAFALFVTARGEEQIPAASLRDGDVWEFKVEDKAGGGMNISTGIIPSGTYLMRVSGQR
jgi:hypothetical protein